MKYDVGITFGVFDLFHVGHLNLLEKCKSLCNKFIVAVCNDDYVKNIKKVNPVFNQDDRLRIVCSLKCVDDAFLVGIDETLDKSLIFNRIKFNVLFSGDDWKNSQRFVETEIQMKKLGVDVIYFPYTQGVSTTKIKQKIV